MEVLSPERHIKNILTEVYNDVPYPIVCLFYIPVTGSFSVVDVDPREQDVLAADEEDQHTQEAGDADDQTESDDPLHPQVKPLDQVTSQKRAPTPGWYSCIP